MSSRAIVQMGIQCDRGAAGATAAAALGMGGTRPAVDAVLLPRPPVVVVPVIVPALRHALVVRRNARLHLRLQRDCQPRAQHRLREVVFLPRPQTIEPRRFCCMRLRRDDSGTPPGR